MFGKLDGRLLAQTKGQESPDSVEQGVHRKMKQVTASKSNSDDRRSVR